MDAIYTENILRLGERYQGTEMSRKGAFGNGDKAGMDEDDDDDDNGAAMMKMFTRVDDRISDAALAQKQLARAVRTTQQHAQIIANCEHCVESSLSKCLTIATGDQIVLRLKHGPSVLAEGHCVLCPLQHTSPSFLQVEEDAMIELQKFKAGLRRMFEARGLSVLFLESAVSFGRHPHAVIDCVPIEIGMEQDAQMFFREALMSADEEWNQHKKVIDLTHDRPLRRAVPSKFQYVCCDWGSESNNSNNSSSSNSSSSKKVTGAVHVVENESLVSADFCLDVVAGMLDQDPIRLRRNKKQNGKGNTSGPDPQTIAAVASFKTWWEPHDWTTQK